MKRTLIGLVVGLIVISLPLALFSGIQSARAAYNANNLISDAEFINSGTLDATGVQLFLNSRGGTRLRAFSEGGRSAAQIIADYSRANGINPLVVLATIQKEESLVDSNTNFDFRVNWAMGYAICDSCSLDDPNVVKYKGFTKQIDNAAWQLKHNYNIAASDANWGVGRTMIIDDTAVTFANRATSALYRYTPHLGGNINFYDIYNSYKGFRYVSKNSVSKTVTSKLTSGKSVLSDSQSAATFSAQYINQVGASGLYPGQRLIIYAYLKNTGTSTWTNGGAHPVYLGNSSPQDRSSVFTGGNIRWHMISSSVLPGRVGVFSIQVTAPSVGTYVEKFRPVAEGVTWFGDEVTFTFNVSGASLKTK